MNTTADQFGDAWYDDAFNRILKAPTVHEALTVAASYLTDLMDSLAHHRGENELLGDYRRLIDRELGLIDSTPHGDEEGQGAIWEMGRAIIVLYERSTTWTENKLIREVDLSFRQFLSPEHPLDIAIRRFFVAVLAYHYGGVKGVEKVPWY